VPTVQSSAIFAKKPAARVPAVYDLWGPDLHVLLGRSQP
jgi:hypothetical protein